MSSVMEWDDFDGSIEEYRRLYGPAQRLPEYRDTEAERFALMQGWYVDLYDGRTAHETN